ncbi:MAG: 4-hydroxy-tetrahydrodipicolinate reductase, partial [Synechococcus sp. Tobar2m-G35]|nr:4-hydroxy-tetrahydrodipicolinate reductase [Synechococcus sp. Tobar2m-G35]
MTDSTIPVLVAGALGRMGAEVVRAVLNAADCTLVGAVDTTPGSAGDDIGERLGLGSLDVAVSPDLEGSLCLASQQHPGSVLVDFTHPAVVYEHTRAAIAYGVAPVIGTTGLSPEQLADLARLADRSSMG